MLFSGGTGTKGTPPKETKKERKPDRDEKYEIQEAIFLRWANSVMEENLQEMREMADVKFLSKFAHQILGVPVALSGKNEADDIDAIFHAMVPDEPEDKLFQISVNELLSGQQKPLLTMCWQLIQIHWKKFAPAPSNQRKMTEALKEWCLEATSSHPDILINDFTSSFRDGMAINILIKSFDDSLVDLHEISELRGEDRIENALSLARRHFRVAKLIQPKEFYSEHLDMKSVATYLMMLYLGMCESSNRSKAPTRRRSTAPANVGGIPPAIGGQSTVQSTQPVPSQMPTATTQSLPQTPTSPTFAAAAAARQSSIVAAANVPAVMVAPQIQQHQKFRTDSTTSSVLSSASMPAGPIAAVGPRIVQANMLTPPPVPQSPKAYAPLMQQQAAQGNVPPIISPLAQQSHTQAQLMQQQQQIQAVQQAQMLQQQQVLAVPPGVVHQQQMPPTLPGQLIPPQIPAQYIPLPTVQIASQPLPPLIQQPMPQSPPHQQIAQQPQLPSVHVQIVPSHQPQIQLVQTAQQPAQMLISPEQQQLMASGAQLPPISIPALIQPQIESKPDFQQQQPLSPKSLAQFTLPQHSADGSAEGMRSRKSSSCSSTSRSRRRKPEELMQEYGNYLQQVLNWLTEAEQELASISEVHEGEGEIDSLELAKEKFREHEQYMQSLTQSQENVGRVLHRGHQLSQRLEGHESTAIISQLQVVSGRWEKIREKAMERQTALQNQIDRIQREHLAELMGWLDKAEWRAKEIDPLADSTEKCQRQLADLGEFKNFMEEKRPAIERLSTFVAVIEQQNKNEGEGGKGEAANLLQLETLVKQVEKRWSKLGDQLELRAKLLDGLAELLGQYDESSGELSKWLEGQSQGLQGLRQARELETGEQVQEQLDMLRGMEKSLEKQQEAFVRLSRICSELAGKFEKGRNLKASEKIHEKLDSITKRWDEIVTRLEDHSEMLIQSGKVKLATDQQQPKEEGKEAEIGGKERQRLELPKRLETIYSVDESRLSESPTHQRVGSTKKRKLLQPPTEHLIEEEPTKKELRFAQGESGGSGEEEGQKGGGKEVEGKEEEAIPMEIAASDLSKEKIKDIEAANLEQPSSSGVGEPPPPPSVSPSEAEAQQTVNKFVQMITEMDRKIRPLVEWAQSMEGQQPVARQNVRQMVLICQKKLNEVREMEPAVTKMQIQLEFMHNRSKLNPKQLHGINEIFDTFMSRWSRVVATISKVLSGLSKPEPLIKSPSKTPPQQPIVAPEKQNRILVMIDQLSKWLKASAKYLDELPPAMPISERLKKIGQIAKQLSEQQAQLSHVKRVAKFTPDESKAMSELENEMVLLVGRIDKMRRAGEQEQKEAAAAMGYEPPKSPRTTTVQMKKDSLEETPVTSPREKTTLFSLPSTSSADEFSPPPQNEAESLRQKLLAEEAEETNREKLRHLSSGDEGRIGGEGGGDWSKWIQEKQGQLKLGGECVPGDLKVLSAELERCDQMITELRGKLREASSSESDAEMMVAPIEQLLRAAETKRNHCVDSINKTQLAIHKAVKVEEIGDKFKRELDWLRRNLADSPLREADERLKHLKTSLQAQEGIKAEAIQLLEEVAQMATTSSIPPTGQLPYGGNAGEQMRNRIQKLQIQWKQLEEEIEDLLACCSRECHRRAESWLHTKQALLEELETALKASFESATDAEELSEHLDNLERLLDRLGSIEREAQDEGYQLELTAFDPRIVALRDQNEALTRATLERCTQLRNAISRCEQFEQRLCQMQHWCTNMHQILNQRLASDTFALEVPHEYKEEQRSGTLFKKMDKEFAEYDQLVAELEEYISQSKSEFASTERLKLQLDHANQQLSQLRAKYAEFKQPIGLFERMDRIEKQLGEIELSMDDLTGIQAENCEFCLLHVEQLQRQLEELGTECAACEAGRDTLIREGILEEAQAIKITARLATLTAKCVDELEPRAKANVQRLKRASELLEKLERENAVLDKLLGEVEHRLEGELDQTMMEGRPTQRSVKALDELSRQLRAATDAAAKARELETLLRQLSIRLSQETLNGIAKSEQRCSKLKDRLSQWSEKIQELAESSQTGESETDEERTLGKIDELANELERRIGQLEQNVAKEELSREQLQEQMAEIRPLKERFEKRALQMLNKVDFSKRVAPALADLTSRWQTLNQILLEKQKEEQKARERAAREQVADQILAQVEEDLIGEIQQGIEEQGAGDLPHLMEPLGARIGSQEPMEFSDFGQRVQSMIDQFAKAKRHLNYAKHPLRSLDDWERRLTELGKYIADRKLNFDGLIAEGKHVAEVGPMELVTSAALAKLDELIELVHELDEQIEREEARLHKMRKQFGKFNEQVGLTRERLAAMEQKAANLNQRAIDPTPIITLQQELMDTSGQLQLLQLSAEELRKSLPPAMHQERIGGDVLDHLNRQLHEIEARVQTALLRALQAQQDEAEEEQPPQFGQQPEEEEEEGTEEEGYSLPMASTSSEPVAAAMPLGQFNGADDRIQPTNRIAAPSFSNADNQFPAAKGPTTLLAMDAYGTDEEEAKGIGRRRASGGIVATKDQKEGKMEGGPDEFLQSSMTPHLPSTSALNQKSKTTTPKSGKQKTSIEQILPPQMEELVSLDQFYVNLNTMEEYMDQQESLPFEGLDEKADILKDFETELQRGEQLVGARQMTMEVGESEHIRGRIATLRGRLAKRMGELKRRRETIAALDQFFGQCELMLDELAQNCKSPRQSPRRVKSPQHGGEKEGKMSPSAGAAPVVRNRSPDLDELETAQAQLESQLPPIAVRLQQIQNRLNSIAEQLTANARDKFQQRIRLLVEDFNECTKIVRAKRKALEERFADQTHLNQQLEELEFWCDETEALVDTADHLGPLNPPKLEKHIERVRQRHCSADAKIDSFRQLERLKDRFVGLASVEPQAKHEVRRNVAQLGKRISDVRMKLKEKMDTLFEEKISADELWREFAAMQIWVENAEHQVRAVENAKIFKPSLANIEKLVGQISENRFALQNIQRKLAEQKQMEEGVIGGVEKENLMRVDDLIRAFEEVVVQIERLIEQRAVASEESSSVEEEIEQLYSQMDLTKEKLAKTTRDQQRELEEGERHYPAQMMNGHPQGEESDGELGARGMGMGGPIEYGTLSTHSGEIGEGGRQSAVGEIPISPLGMDNDSVGEEFGGKYPRRRMSLGEQARLDTVTRLRSWLQEVERDIAASVDLSDQHLVRQALGKMQNCVDDIQINQLEIIRVLDEAKDRLIVERAQLCSAEMERVLGVCKRRKGDLQKILEQCRIWEQLRSAIELWLTEANERLTSGGRVLELTDPELAEQLELCGGLANELDAWKEKLQEMNRVSNQLLDIYRRDDGHNLSHLSSKLNTQWTKFNDQLRIRRAVLEAAQRSRHDFQTAIGHFQQWLNRLILELQKLEKETENAQRLKDTGRRREWLAQEKEARMEIDAHRDMMESVKKMGRKLLEEQQLELSALGGEDLGTASSKAREQLRKRVEAIESEWQALQELNKIVRDRLESAQEECERLTQSLAEFLFWTDQQRKTIANTQPVAGDLSAVQKQCDIVRTIQRGVEARERPVEECIQLAHEFLMQHNLRPPLHHPSLMAEPPADPYSPKTEAEREERRVGQQINSDSKQLQTQWALLKEELNGWYQQVSDAYKEMQDLDRAMAEALLSIGQVEEELHALKPVEDLLLEELKAAKAESAEFRQRVHEASTHVDDVNNWASSIQATGIQLSEQVESQVHTVNERFDRLKRDLGCRWAALERAFNDFGPASEHFLVDLVEPPWQRAISNTNRLPYYIDHSTERTQWDHPAMVDIMEGLSSFNQVKFSAYRTAMKCRALQKRLCLDLIDLPDLNVQYEKHLASYTDDQRIQVEDVIQCLLPLFEKAHEERPALVPNVSLAVDLTLNLLLNIYDQCRDGKMRVLSFKVALVVLCHATLESKYIYLFHLISNKDGVDHKRLAVLFYDLIHIPKFLGEAAAFGGSNIEPSVRSCFENAKFPPTINVDQFLEWLKKEPQSLVWLPVMHRLASSEFAKHQAKCNACKMFPIVGLRYRCLRCFNFDICQNCFFSQRIAKSHKLNHPMQEYCTPTSTGDDVRDFTAVIKNKMRQGKGKIGYLPVDQILEGPPLECTDQCPQNADTEGMHQRMQLIASRLDKRQTEAIEHFPSAIILPSADGLVGKFNVGSRNVQMGSLPGPIMIGNGTESENGSSSNNENEPMESRPKHHHFGAHLQSPEIQIFHDRQHQLAALAAAHQDVKSPSQLVNQVDQVSKEELGQLLQKLQYENIELKRKIEERRKAIRAGIPYQNGATSTPNLYSRTPLMGYNGNRQASEVAISQQKMANMQTTAPLEHHTSRARSISSVGQTPMPTIFAPQQPAVLPPPVPRQYNLAGRSMPASLHRQHSLGSPIYQSSQFDGTTAPGANDHEQQMAVLAETHQLRMHQKRLEERGVVLEDQNRQLQMQLERLQKLMEKKGETPIPMANLGGPLGRRDLAIAQSAGVISSTDAEDTDMEMLGIRSSDIRNGGGMSTVGQIGTEIRRNRMDRLRETVDELNRAMENFVQFTQNCAANGAAAARREHPDTDQDSGTADQEEGQITTDEHEGQ